MIKNQKLQFFLVLLLGLIIPFIVIVLLNVLKYDHYTFGEFVMVLFRLEVFDRFIQFSAIPNLALFFVFLWTKLMYAARGVIAATFLLVIVVLILMI